MMSTQTKVAQHDTPTLLRPYAISNNTSISCSHPARTSFAGIKSHRSRTPFNPLPLAKLGSSAGSATWYQSVCMSGGYTSQTGCTQRLYLAQIFGLVSSSLLWRGGLYLSTTRGFARVGSSSLWGASGCPQLLFGTKIKQQHQVGLRMRDRGSLTRLALMAALVLLLSIHCYSPSVEQPRLVVCGIGRFNCGNPNTQHRSRSKEPHFAPTDCPACHSSCKRDRLRSLIYTCMESMTCKFSLPHKYN